MQSYLDWFDHHVRFHMSAAPDNAMLMERKQRHTLRVLEHVREISKESGARQELRDAMEIAALLHDVGRFPQLTATNSYDDMAGLDHGEAGARILAESDVLNSLSDELQNIILSTVKFHNNGTLPSSLSSDTRLILAVIRDADKLDAIRNNLRYLDPEQPYGKALKSGLVWDDKAVSPEVLERAGKRELIPFSAINWSNDFILFLCCWIYDMGFHYTFTFLKDSGLYDELLSKLPDNEQFNKLKEQLRDDLGWINAKSKS